MMNLKDFAIDNIEEQLNNVFCERKMTGKLRKQVAGDMAVIASNAFRLGWYAALKIKNGECATSEQFDAESNQEEVAGGVISCIDKYLLDIIWRIQEAGK
jgi:hypothetical protein